MNQNDFENALIRPADMDHISNMLMNSGAMNMLFNQTKRMMWSMVESSVAWRISFPCSLF